ncbi:hypothetical protein Geob_3038 [Geotalea daltonii FRC-32]|uniref:DUF3311 domain-containing protein n=1 Tax=Geotalea daltonii (strain DSM 22248 / JCM 15807 / FRC-32) TaxID=316067 RepID=B9M3G0_GEODF|nr:MULTISPECIES: hypothetical protein [Geotalea]ACM21381.1 hypothetical protein Geob_3038 [Geotalea daltonii FRC-32]
MRMKLKQLLLLSLRTRESWVIFFILGIIMMNYPFISIFNKPIYFFDLPLLYLYLQLGWLISIFVIFLFTKANHFADKNNNHKGRS